MNLYIKIKGEFVEVKLKDEVSINSVFLDPSNPTDYYSEYSVDIVIYKEINPNLLDLFSIDRVGVFAIPYDAHLTGEGIDMYGSIVSLGVYEDRIEGMFVSSLSSSVRGDITLKRLNDIDEGGVIDFARADIPDVVNVENIKLWNDSEDKFLFFLNDTDNFHFSSFSERWYNHNLVNGKQPYINGVRYDNNFFPFDYCDIYRNHRNVRDSLSTATYTKNYYKQNAIEFDEITGSFNSLSVKQAKSYEMLPCLKISKVLERYGIVVDSSCKIGDRDIYIGNHFKNSDYDYRRVESIEREDREEMIEVHPITFTQGSSDINYIYNNTT